MTVKKDAQKTASVGAMTTEQTEHTRNRNIEQTARVLFECLMNRIYNVSDFERLGAMNSRERDAIDAWLTLAGQQ